MIAGKVCTSDIYHFIAMSDTEGQILQLLTRGNKISEVQLSMVHTLKKSCCIQVQIPVPVFRMSI